VVAADVGSGSDVDDEAWEEGGSECAGELAPRAQLVITGSWLTMKEVSLLLGTLARAIPLSGACRLGQPCRAGSGESMPRSACVLFAWKTNRTDHTLLRPPGLLRFARLWCPPRRPVVIGLQGPCLLGSRTLRGELAIGGRPAVCAAVLKSARPAFRRSVCPRRGRRRAAGRAAAGRHGPPLPARAAGHQAQRRHREDAGRLHRALPKARGLRRSRLCRQEIHRNGIGSRAACVQFSVSKVLRPTPKQGHRMAGRARLLRQAFSSRPAGRHPPPTWACEPLMWCGGALPGAGCWRSRRRA
jgi:Putative death-receptor fusion protein (DUF2428)